MGKKGVSKKGGGKKGKKIVEDAKIVWEMQMAAAKNKVEDLQKHLEVPPGPERKWDLTQTAGECMPLAAENGCRRFFGGADSFCDEAAEHGGVPGVLLELSCPKFQKLSWIRRVPLGQV